jgi:hypothetical protein
LYFSEWIRLEKTSVNNAKPVATAMKMAIGMYDEGIGNSCRVKMKRDRRKASVL